MYDPACFAEDIRHSAYQLPALAQRYLRRARALRLQPVDAEQAARLARGVQWLVAAMAYAIRPRTDEHTSAALTRVLLADASLRAITDTLEQAAFAPDDWVSMFALLADELALKEYGALAVDVFAPFVAWMHSRPPRPLPPVVRAGTPTEPPPPPPPLFLPSPGIPESACTSTSTSASPHRPKRARAVSPSTPVPGAKRARTRSARAGGGPCSAVVPAAPAFVSPKTKTASRLGLGLGLAPAPAIALALAPAVWRVSSSSPLASPVSCFPPARTPPPPGRNERKSVLSRGKFAPTGNAAGNVCVGGDEACGVVWGEDALGAARPGVLRRTAGSVLLLGEAGVLGGIDSSGGSAAFGRSGPHDGNPGPGVSGSKGSVVSSGSGKSAKSRFAPSSGSVAPERNRNKSSTAAGDISDKRLLSDRSGNAEKFAPAAPARRG
ncbi:hypothetical protein C0993_005783, partial [Termitomyces sp. T159_Od127]